MGDFIINNYIWIIIICLFVIFTLIGYMTDKSNKKNKDKTKKVQNEEKDILNEKTEENKLENVSSVYNSTELTQNNTPEVKPQDSETNINTPTLDELIEKSNMDNNVVLPTINVEEHPKQDDEETKVYNSWEPELNNEINEQNQNITKGDPN